MMIYGAQSDKYDYHKVGFDESLLTHFLHQNGFCHIERTGNFNLFNDTSNMQVDGIPISLNIAANKCMASGKSPSDGFSVQHQADQYIPVEFPFRKICSACGKKENIPFN